MSSRDGFMVGEGVSPHGGRRLRPAGWVCGLVVVVSLLVGQQAWITHDLAAPGHDDHHCDLCLASASLAGAPLASGWAVDVGVAAPDQYLVALVPPAVLRTTTACARAPPLPA